MIGRADDCRGADSCVKRLQSERARTEENGCWWEWEIIKKTTTTKWKTQEANLIKKRQFYLVLSKFSLQRSLNDLVILPLCSRRSPSICSAVLSKQIIRQQNMLRLKENKTTKKNIPVWKPHQTAVTLFTCLFIYPSDSQGLDMIFIVWLLLHILSLGAVMTRIQAQQRMEL